MIVNSFAFNLFKMILKFNILDDDQDIKILLAICIPYCHYCWDCMDVRIFERFVVWLTLVP